MAVLVPCKLVTLGPLSPKMVTICPELLGVNRLARLARPLARFQASSHPTMSRPQALGTTRDANNLVD